MTLSRFTAFAVAASLTAIAAFPTEPAAAAVRMPRVSPAASVSQDLGFTTIQIKYHRPGVKGRKIWGGLVPYDQVWRLGANNATTISFNTPVKIGGKEIAAGTYALFAVPGAAKWQFVLNSQADQWGAYNHKTEADVVKIDATPRAGADTEWMQITISPEGEGKANVEVAWEKVRVGFPIEVDVRKLVWAEIDKALSDNPKDADALLVAARYANETGDRLDQAIGWLDTALGVKETYALYDTKAALLVRAGKKAEAAPLLEKVLTLAPAAGAPQEYLDGIRQRLAEIKKP
jgi:hypothetical protein